MRKLMETIAFAALVVLLAGCGSSSSAGDEDVTTVEDTAHDSTQPGEDTVDPGEDTVDPGEDTVDPGEDTVEPQGTPHPYWAVAKWETIWPQEEATATYAVQVISKTVDMEAHIEWNADRDGETWHRGVLGTPEPGSNGMVIWFDDSIPWEPTVKGVEVYSAEVEGSATLNEYFSEPLVIPLGLAEGQSETATGTITMVQGGEEFSMGAEYTLTPLSFDETVELPMSTINECAHFKVTVAGEFMGEGYTMDVFFWIHPEHFIVKMTDTPGYPLVELKEGWE